MSYKKQITFNCDWENKQFECGDLKFSLEDIKFDDTLKDLVKANLDHTELSILRLTYPEIYNEFYRLEPVVDWNTKEDPKTLHKRAMQMRDYLRRINGN